MHEAIKSRIKKKEENQCNVYCNAIVIYKSIEEKQKRTKLSEEEESAD